MKKKFYIMAVVLSLVLMTIPFWGAFANPGGDFTVTFNLNGGTSGGNSTVAAPASPGALLSTVPFPSADTREGYTFDGWNLGGVSPSAITVMGDMTINAMWSSSNINTGGGSQNVAPTPHPGYLVTFDFAQGSAACGATSATARVTSGGALTHGQIPIITLEGHNFLGWQVAGDPSSPIRPFASMLTLSIDSDITFVARWGAPFRVTFLPGDARVGATLAPSSTGQLMNCGRVEIPMVSGSVINADQIPRVSLPAGSNWVFVGWVITDGQQCSASGQGGAAGHVVVGNVSFTAQFAIRVTFDLVGGNVPSCGTHGYVHLTVQEGSTLTGRVPQPVRGGRTFLGWRRVDRSGSPVGIRGQLLSHACVAATTITNDFWRFEAVWGTLTCMPATPAPSTQPTPAPSTRPTPAPSTCPTPAPSTQPVIITVRLAPGVGTLPANVSNIITGPHGFRVANLPTPIPPSGYAFVGWFMHGAQVTAAFSAVANVTLYAHYHPIVCTATMFTLTFVPNGGTMPAGVGTVHTHASGTVLNALPIPTRVGYAFSGWHHACSVIVPPLTVRQDMTLTAVWLPLRVAGDPYVSPTPAPSTQPTPAPSTCPAPSPTPAPSTQPTPAPSTCPTPAPSNQPTPAPSTCPTPAPSASVPPPRFNPQTGPLQISFAVFGSVMFIGLAAFGIMQLISKQKAAAGEYSANMTRFNREERILGMFKKDGDE